MLARFVLVAEVSVLEIKTLSDIRPIFRWVEFADASCDRSIDYRGLQLHSMVPEQRNNSIEPCKRVLSFAV